MKWHSDEDFLYLGLRLGVSIRPFPGRRHDGGWQARVRFEAKRYEVIDMPTCEVRMGQSG